MDNENIRTTTNLRLLTLGFLGGLVLAYVLFALGVTPTKLNIGPVEFSLSTPTTPFNSTALPQTSNLTSNPPGTSRPNISVRSDYLYIVLITVLIFISIASGYLLGKKGGLLFKSKKILESEVKNYESTFIGPSNFQSPEVSVGNLLAKRLDAIDGVISTEEYVFLVANYLNQKLISEKKAKVLLKDFDFDVEVTAKGFYILTEKKRNRIGK